MYRQFSQSDLKLSTPVNADTSLHWRDYPPSPVSLPLCAKIADKYYLLCGSNAEMALIFNAENKFDALAQSIEAMGTQSITFPEWVGINKICTTLNCAIENLPMPELLRNNYLDVVKQAVGWDKDLMAYIAKKNHSLHVLQMISLLPNKQKEYLAEIVRVENLSTHAFKLVIEKLRDFSQEINSTVYDKAEFERITDRRTDLHTELDSILAELRLAKNPDNYESTTLNWTFSTRNTADFKNALRKLKEKETLVERFYRLQNGNGK